MTEFNNTEITQSPPDPYQNPQETYANIKSVDPKIVAAAKATKPWLRFLAIMGFLSSGLMLLLGFVMIGLSAIASEFAEMSILQGLMIGSFYILGAFVYLLPTIKLWKYGTSINNLALSNKPEDLFQFIEAQRSFWKTIGVISLIWIGMVFLFMGMAFIFGIFTAVMSA